MADQDYLLTLPQLMGETIRLVQPCHVGIEPNGDPIKLDAMDPRSFGRSFLADAGPDLLWHARTQCKSLDALKDVYGFHCGAIVSPRAQTIIQEDNIPNIGFIPVEIHCKNDFNNVLGTWWFVNVFNWRKVFDFS
jgi:hypothetical protein